MLVAMVLAVLGITSGLTFTSLAMKQAVGFGFDYDYLEGMHLLRSEAKRCHKYVELTGLTSGTLTTPAKAVYIASSHMRKTYTLKSKIETTAVTEATAGGASDDAGTYLAKSLITSRHGKGSASMWQSDESIVKTYGEHYLRKRTFAEFMYFTDNDSSTNDTPVYFFGPDVLYGKVHSNSDIWLKQAGGGNNNNWPTFYGKVTTSGHINSYSGTPPWDSVFLGGYQEEYYTYEYPPEASTLKDAAHRFGVENANDLIYMVEVNGTSGIITQGRITNVNRESAHVFNPYPPAGAPNTQLFTNHYSIWDTTWTSAGTVNPASQSIFCWNNLWIQGEFRGMQTIGSADTIYLIGDILLAGTEPGNAPDESPVNKQDIVGIVSEKSILIKYGHRDPSDSLRYHNNCGPATDGIFIYAALCALGAGENSYTDGVFSFEYQRPHGSTPSFVYQNQLYNNIDLHRRRYPQTTAEPWPGEIDYPLYNPLWPERAPYKERGTIHLWGAVAQRRRGFVHRSPYDTEHPSNGVWNIPIDYTGASANSVVNDQVLGIALAAIDYPGASGTGVGYAKNYHFDKRFLTRSPRDFPEVNLRGGSMPLESESWVLRRAPRNF